MRLVASVLVMMLALSALAQDEEASMPSAYQRPMLPEDPQYQFGQLMQLATNPSYRDAGLSPEAISKLAAHVQDAFEQIGAMSKKTWEAVCAQRDTIDREGLARLIEQNDAATHALEKKVVDEAPAVIGPEHTPIFQRAMSTIKVSGVTGDGGAVVRSPGYPFEQVLRETCGTPTASQR